MALTAGAAALRGGLRRALASRLHPQSRAVSLRTALQPVSSSSSSFSSSTSSSIPRSLPRVRRQQQRASSSAPEGQQQSKPRSTDSTTTTSGGGSSGGRGGGAGGEQARYEREQQQWLRVQEERPFSELTVAEKVVETSKDVGSIGVILAGLGLAGVFLSGLAYELFRSETPESLQAKSLTELQADMRVSDLVGGEVRLPRPPKPPKAAEYRVGQTDYLRMEYAVVGNVREALVKMELKRPVGKSEGYRYRYLLVQCGQQRVVLVDNRREDQEDHQAV